MLLSPKNVGLSMFHQVLYFCKVMYMCNVSVSYLNDSIQAEQDVSPSYIELLIIHNSSNQISSTTTTTTTDHTSPHCILISIQRSHTNHKDILQVACTDHIDNLSIQRYA